jgi:hypothetical protein
LAVYAFSAYVSPLQISLCEKSKFFTVSIIFRSSTASDFFVTVI